jgi:hypothetical protein
MTALRVTDHPTIPEDELTVTFSRSAGPGGQNVNKVSSRVTLWFDLPVDELNSRVDRERRAFDSRREILPEQRVILPPFATLDEITAAAGRHLDHLSNPAQRGCRPNIWCRFCGRFSIWERGSASIPTGPFGSAASPTGRRRKARVWCPHSWNVTERSILL